MRHARALSSRPRPSIRRIDADEKLFDLEADPGEQVDLKRRFPEVFDQPARRVEGVERTDGGDAVIPRERAV